MASDDQHSNAARPLKGAKAEDLEPSMYAAICRLFELGADPMEVAVAIESAFRRIESDRRPASAYRGAYGHRPGA